MERRGSWPKRNRLSVEADEDPLTPGANEHNNNNADIVNYNLYNINNNNDNNDCSEFECRRRKSRQVPPLNIRVSTHSRDGYSSHSNSSLTSHEFESSADNFSSSSSEWSANSFEFPSTREEHSGTSDNTPKIEADSSPVSNYKIFSSDSIKSPTIRLPSFESFSNRSHLRYSSDINCYQPYNGSAYSMNQGSLYNSTSLSPPDFNNSTSMKASKLDNIRQQEAHISEESHATVSSSYDDSYANSLIINNFQISDPNIESEYQVADSTSSDDHYVTGQPTSSKVQASSTNNQAADSSASKSTYTTHQNTTNNTEGTGGFNIGYLVDSRNTKECQPPDPFKLSHSSLQESMNRSPCARQPKYQNQFQISCPRDSHSSSESRSEQLHEQLQLKSTRTVQREDFLHYTEEGTLPVGGSSSELPVKYEEYSSSRKSFNGVHERNLFIDQSKEKEKDVLLRNEDNNRNEGKCFPKFELKIGNETIASSSGLYEQNLNSNVNDGYSEKENHISRENQCEYSKDGQDDSACSFDNCSSECESCYHCSSDARSSTCSADCGPNCGCSDSDFQSKDNSEFCDFPEVKWTARLLGGDEKEVEAFKAKKLATMKK